MQKIKIAIGQYSPVHLDLDGSLKKLERIVAEAHQEKAEFLVLGETWLSGYPAWLDHCPYVGHWDYDPMKKVFLKFRDGAVAIPSQEFDFIAGLAKNYSIALAIGLNEKVDQGVGNGTIYNSFVLLDSNGELMNHHRKLVPTFTEKLLYGTGDGYGLKTVDTASGRIGGSICWEHWMPLCRQALHDAGEHIHVSFWPMVHDVHQVASRSYAFEGRCFVLAAGQVLSAKDFPAELELPDYLKQDPNRLVLRGGSCVIGPDGKFLIEPLFDREELITCEINLEEVYKERMTLDVSGHYQRRDVFSFDVNRNRY